ncbi:MAG: AAA family ATPase [Flavobacteriales bacterium]|nr:AAA family ATPase [Flavobacteriales bacterium]
MSNTRPPERGTDHMQCGQCHSENPKDAKFCAQCGAGLVRTCPACHVEVLPAAKFCHECGTSLDVRERTAGNHAAPQLPDAAEPFAVLETSHAEQRQLSVIFCDLVSFTQLSQQLDPEDLNTVVHAYYEVCRAVCERYEGHVANYLGDGVLMYFGYPKAHEDDAHRAVRTGLAVIEGIAALNERMEREMKVRLSVRVGIHTGPMIVGDDRAGDWQKMALGETLNIAARVQGVAQEDTVVVSTVTKQMVEGFFTMRSIGTHTLKGVAQPMEVFTVTHESTARGRLEAAGRATLTPLTGRDAEVGILIEEWKKASAGQGRAVLISAEGGMGKSRLVQMLKEHVAASSIAWLTPCQCSPYHQSTSMYPYIDLIERVVLKFERQETPREKLKKIEGMLVQYGFHIPEILPVFGAFHSLPPEAGYTPTAMDPAQQRRKYMDAMLRILDDRSRRQPLLFVVEDLHWSDPTSLETFKELVEIIKRHRMLLLFTCRPEFNSPWDGHPSVHTMRLPRLDADQTRELCKHVARRKQLPEEVVEQIIERADGVPLFAEELTKMIIGSGLMTESGDRYVLDGPLPPLAIPNTLQDSLMARLDRLSAVKEIAQIGAVIGREFSYEMIHYVHPLDDAVLRHSLEQLVDAEIIDQVDPEPRSTYSFKHALVQEAAYRSLIKSRRQHHHRLVAHALEEHFPEVAELEPEILALHYGKANLGWQAIPYLQRAGEKAAARSAHAEAITHFSRGLEQVQALSDSGQRWQLEIRLLIGQGASLTAIHGYGAKDVEQTYSHARDLCEQFGTPGQLFQASYGLWRLHMLRAEYHIATKQGENLLELASRQENDAFLIAAHRALGSTLFYRGEFERSKEHCESVIAMTGEEGDGATLIRDIYDVVDPRVTCRSYLSWILWMQGFPEKAKSESARAIALAERLEHPFSIALALSFAAWLEQFLGNAARVEELANKSIVHCVAHGFGFWIGWDQVLLGWASAMQGADPAEQVANINNGLALWKEKGSELGRGYFYSLLADVHLRAGEPVRAMELLTRARTFMYERDERYWEAERQRMSGDAELAMGTDAKQAIIRFRDAKAIAKRQGATSLELRAAISLARLEKELGDGNGALKELADVLATMTEGQSTQEVLAARAIID